MADVPYQSLYRRYRPQRFAEVLGQDHVVLALRNAVRDAKTTHAYLFSGPRGTGKTSVARILAKALNCEHATEGEPDGTCDSCRRIQDGSSLDVHELDAASNNGVDAMRDLVSRTALGTPGRWKVYIVDEVHMLSTAASNALLKTLEEPPAHVVFVLATTDPQKVLPTIRSRTQHFEFKLLSPELLGKLVQQINGDANLHVPSEALDLVVRRGRGSARDTLSVLDQVAAAGVVDDEQEVLDEIVEALCERDTGRALVALAEGINNGREPLRLAVDLLEYLRNGFLALMAKSLVPLADTARDHVEEQARRLGTPSLVRSMDAIGEALLQMRDAPETRVTLEVALVRLTRPELDTSPGAIVARLQALERGVPHQATAAASQQAAPATATRQAPTTAPVTRPQPASPTTTPKAVSPDSERQGPRPALGGLRRPAAPAPAPTSPESAPAPKQEAMPAPAPQASPPVGGTFPTRDQLVQVWGDVILDQLPQRARSRFRSGRFVSADGGHVLFALPNAIHRDRCEELRNEVETVLRQHFGVRIQMQLVVEDDTQSAATPSQPEAEEIIIHLDETTVDDSAVMSPKERLLQAFPGAEEIS